MKKKAALCSGGNEENEIAIGKFLTHFSHNSPIATLRMQMPVEAIIRRAYTSIISQGCRALTSCVCLYRQKRKKPGTDTQANTTQSAAKKHSVHAEVHCRCMYGSPCSNGNGSGANSLDHQMQRLTAPCPPLSVTSWRA